MHTKLIKLKRKINNESTFREENKFGRKECGIKDCELDL